jgi:hypothetical protein
VRIELVGGGQVDGRTIEIDSPACLVFYVPVYGPVSLTTTPWPLTPSRMRFDRRPGDTLEPIRFDFTRIEN